jgi:transposase
MQLIYKVRHLIKTKRIILIVDNARIHRTNQAKKYCLEHNILLVYMPAYSPDLNPIELLRRMLKKEFRKIQWLYDDIWKSVSISAKKLSNRLSPINISSLVDII